MKRYSELLEQWEQEAYHDGYGADWLADVGEGIKYYAMNCDKNATELRPDRNPDIITNADRIRSMSDEELAEFISRIEIGDFGQQVYGKTFCDMCKGQYECDDCRLWWLQQPAEEDT